MESEGSTYHSWLERRLVLSLQELTPVDRGEEWVCLDLRGAVGTQTSLRVTVEELLKEILRGRWNDLGPWEVQWVAQDLAIHLVGVLVVEGR